MRKKKKKSISISTSPGGSSACVVKAIYLASFGHYNLSPQGSFQRLVEIRDPGIVWSSIPFFYYRT